MVLSDVVKTGAVVNNAENHPPAKAVPLLRKEGSKEKTHRFQVYLTNALEEYHPDTGVSRFMWLASFASVLSQLAKSVPVSG